MLDSRVAAQKGEKLSNDSQEDFCELSTLIYLLWQWFLRITTSFQDDKCLFSDLETFFQFCFKIVSSLKMVEKFLQARKNGRESLFTKSDTIRRRKERTRKERTTVPRSKSANSLLPHEINIVIEWFGFYFKRGLHSACLKSTLDLGVEKMAASRRI